MREAHERGGVKLKEVATAIWAKSAHYQHLLGVLLQRASLQELCDPAPALLLDSLNALRVAITVFDSAGRLVYANAHLNYIFRGLPPAETLIGKSYDDIVRLELPEIAPEALSGGAEAFIAARLAQLGERAWAPQDIPLVNGRIIEVKARRDGNGQAILMWNDVTDARHQFARLQEAIKLSADAFAFYDSQDRFVAGNSLYAALTGTTLEDMQGLTFEEIVTKVAASGSLATDGPVEEWLARRLRGHRSPASADTLQTASGRAYLVRDCATSDGGRAVVFTDITEKTRAENALAQTETVLESTRASLRIPTASVP